MNKEIRNLPMTELRTTEVGGCRLIEGHASVFDKWSETLGGIFPFKEKVRAGAFAKSITENDIVALYNHNPDYVLGRNTAKTLELREDAEGLFVRIYPPDTQWARDLLVSIGRGDVNKMSFAFSVQKEAWTTDSDGSDTRELIEVSLYDVSPVVYPAYPDTDCGVRAHKNYVAEKRTKAESERAEADAVKARTRARTNQLKTKFRLMEVKN